jgi:hypothetical protein
VRGRRGPHPRAPSQGSRSSRVWSCGSDPVGGKASQVGYRLEEWARRSTFLSVAGTNAGGGRITIASIMQWQAAGEVPLFPVTATGALPVAEVALGESNYRIALVLAARMAGDRRVLASYAGSSLTCVDGKPLMPLTDLKRCQQGVAPIFSHRTDMGSAGVSRRIR